MSKASEFHKALAAAQDARPESLYRYEGRHNNEYIAGVDENGGMDLKVNWLDEADALRLAHWILKVFGKGI